MAHRIPHLQHELSQNNDRITVATRYGPVIGGRTSNGVALFLEIPYALPPKRFTNPEPLPPDHRYEEKEYITETSYATQPKFDWQNPRVPYEHRVGLGQPSENPLFLNIFIPPSFPAQRKFPVKVYFHEGFLQFGSPHGLSGQAQYVCAEMSEIWVNIGYRLSAFGFLSSHIPKLTGNYGFKDQWLALQWIKSNIESFGGDPDDIQLRGHSIGSLCDPTSHSIHQHLHKVSFLPDGEDAPFQSAILQSGAMLLDPKPPNELQPQFDALCRALKLNPYSRDVLDILRDPIKVPWTEITRVIETEVLGVEHRIFKACLSDDWIKTKSGPMSSQYKGILGRGLLKRGVRNVVVGEVSDEWYAYSLSHPIIAPGDVQTLFYDLCPARDAGNLLNCFKKISNDMSLEEAKEVLGRALSCLLVYLPNRMLYRDLFRVGFPVMRYRIEWTPEQLRPDGYVTHGTDRALWSLLTPLMSSDQVDVARSWLKRVRDETAVLASEKLDPEQLYDVVLKLTKDKKIEWSDDQENFEGTLMLYEHHNYKVIGCLDSVRLYAEPSRASEYRARDDDDYSYGDDDY